MARKYFFIISLIILCLPINYAFLFDFFRLVDVFSIVLIILTFKKWKFDFTEAFLWLFFFIFIFFSSFFGFHNMNYLNLIDGLGFFYKYVFVFTFWTSLSSLSVNQKQLKNIYSMLYIVYFFLLSWVFIYMYLISNKIIAGSYQPTFPFSNSYQKTDAHLYANYLVFSFVFFHLTKKYFQLPKILRIIESLLIIPAIFLTGARNGVLLLFLSIIIIILLNLKKMKNFLNELLYFLSTFIFAVVIILILILYFPSFSSNIETLINRAFSFGKDMSVGRITKFYQALNEASYGAYFFGVGLFSRQGVWYDGIHSQIISAGGFLAFSFFIFICLHYWNKRKVYFTTKPLSYAYSLMLFIYFISNFITEWALVSRSVIPFLFYIFILINLEGIDSVELHSLLLENI